MTRREFFKTVLGKKEEITFQEIKDYVLANCPNAVESIIDATEPFVMDYILCPVGYAETDNANDLQELIQDITMAFVFDPDGRKRRGEINWCVKREKQRWSEGRNAGFFGRHIGRVGYLLTQNK